MLLFSRDHLLQGKGDQAVAAVKTADVSQFSKGTAVSHFLPTSKRIIQFSEGREPKETDRVVYVNGAFDLFRKQAPVPPISPKFRFSAHLSLSLSLCFCLDIGHIEFLKRAKAQGDYLLVGVLEDAVVNMIKGSNFPIMNLHERVLSVLACRYVDEVIIGAPFSVTKDVLEKVYKISAVVHGGTEVDLDEQGVDPYELPKKLGIFKKIVNDGSPLTSTDILTRIMDNRRVYEERNRKKANKSDMEEKLRIEELLNKQAS